MALVAAKLVTTSSVIVASGVILAAMLYAYSTEGTGLFMVDPWVQNLLYAFLIALANNVDNLGARIAYSIQGTRVSIVVNLWISVITFLISFCAAVLGAQAAGSFGTKIAGAVAMALLAGLGSLMILHARAQPWREPPEKDEKKLWSVLLKPHHADIDASKHIDFKEGTVLGIALSINNIGGGLSAGIIGVTPVLVGFLSALISFIALWAGNYAAEFFVKKGIAKNTSIIGGVLLIIIGIKQVF